MRASTARGTGTSSSSAFSMTRSKRCARGTRSTFLSTSPMRMSLSPHSLLPLVAFFLNVTLAGLSLLRNPGSRLNRVFAYFASGMALWNIGSFMLRTSPDASSAVFSEVVIHIGVLLVPAFWYHFVLIFLDATTRHRPSLTLVYAISLVYTIVNLSRSPLFMKGVVWTHWGWAPATGPLYLPFIAAFFFFMIYGLRHLVKANRGIDSSFRRNRGTLIMLGVLISLAGAFIDYARFVVAKAIPAADQVYPMGIPANMVFALMLGTSIVRYRLFAVDLAVKKAAVYGVVGTAVTAVLYVVTRGVEFIRADSPIVQWLTRTEGLLVKEEVKLNPRIAKYFETAEGELEAIKAALIVPLKIENKLNGILLLGEKLSGEIFDSQELDVLSLLAVQAAISLENARLYEGLSTSNVRLMEASRLKSQFLANMSHELRTPLNSIIGFSKVLLNRLDGDLTERQEAYIRSVHNSSRHLLELINGILDFSRIEAGKFEMRPEKVDMLSLVDECIESSLSLVRDKRLKIEKDVPLDLPEVLADRTRIKQVLLNLMSNAIKFTAAGKILVHVRREPEAIHVSVADTGIGISSVDLTRLFEPFQRLDNPLAQQADGTGLGLAISKKFVELHRGHIWAESRESQGATFHFTLPLAAVAS